MNLHDTVSGLLAATLGLAVVLIARTFPPMPGQDIGPALFPTLIGVILCVNGMLLFGVGRRAGGAGLVDLGRDLRRPRMALNLVLVIVAVLIYALAVDRVGFFVMAALLLLVLFAAFGVPLRRAVVMAVVVSVGVHYIFYTLLRVPLPWGVFERFAW